MKKILAILLYCLAATWSQAQEVFEQNGNYGIKAENGETAVKPEYKSIISCNSGYWYQTHKGEWGALDSRLKKAVKPKYTALKEIYPESIEDTDDAFFSAEPILFVLTLPDGHYQFANPYTMEVFPKKPVEAYEVIDAEAGELRLILKTKGRYGVLYTPEPRWELDPKYKHILPVGNQVYIAQREEDWQVLHKNKPTETFSAAEVKPYYEYFQVRKEDRFSLFKLDQDYKLQPKSDIYFDSLRKDSFGHTVFDGGKQGWIATEASQITIPANYDELLLVSPKLSFGYDFADDFGFTEEAEERGFPTITETEHPQIITRKGKKFGLWEGMDGVWEESIPTKYQNFLLLSWEEDLKRAIFQDENGQWALWQGKDFNPAELLFKYDGFKQEKRPAGSLAIIAQKNGKFGLLDLESGEEISEFNLDQLEYTNKKFLYQGSKDQWLFYNVLTKDDFDLPVRNPIFKKLTASSLEAIDNSGRSTKLFLFKKDGKEGLLTQYGDITAEAEYEEIKQWKSVYFFLKKNGKWGLAKLEGKEFSWPPQYQVENMLLPYEYEDFEISNTILRVNKDGKWGAYEVSKDESNKYKVGKQLFQPLYDELYFQEGSSNYLVMSKDGKEGLLGVGEKQGQRFPPEYNWVLYESDSTFRVGKDGKTGTLNLNTGEVAYGKSLESLFSLQWKTPIGKTVFRSNPMLANGMLVIGSNGSTRNQPDEKDGLYLIDPKTGKVKQLLRPETQGKIDVNGQAIEGDRIYFGNENGNAYCYDFSGTQLWQSPIKGEVENSPALADLNQDGQSDAVFATDAGLVYALNGKDGSTLWEYQAATPSYFMATPTCTDLNGDDVPDVLIGAGATGILHALDGKSGKLLWEREGAGIHSPVIVRKGEDKEIELVYAPSYGYIIFLDKEGELLRTIGSRIGSFASPVFLPNGGVVLGTTWWDGKRDYLQAFKTQEAGIWEYNDTYKREELQDKGRVLELMTHSISSTGIAADILSEEDGIEVAIASEAGDFYILSEEGALLSHTYLPQGVECPLFIGDIDQDGKLELLIASLDGYLYCYQTESSGEVVSGQFMGNNQNVGVRK